MAYPKRAHGALRIRREYDGSLAVSEFCLDTVRRVLLHAAKQKWRPLFPTPVQHLSAGPLISRAKEAIGTRDTAVMDEILSPLERCAMSYASRYKWTARHLAVMVERRGLTAEEILRRDKDLEDVLAHSSLQRNVCVVASCATRASYIACTGEELRLLPQNLDRMMEAAERLGSLTGLNRAASIGRLVEQVRRVPHRVPSFGPARAYPSDDYDPFTPTLFAPGTDTGATASLRAPTVAAPPSVPNEPDPFDAFVRSLTAKGKPKG